MVVKFTKMHGLGNDFVVIDATSAPLDLSVQLLQKISNRKTGVGCDQLLIVEAASEPDVDFNYRVINQDGTEVGQCGNGARCLARFVHEQGLTDKRDLIVKTITTRLQLKLNDLDHIVVNMGAPEFEPKKIPFLADSRQDRYSLDINGEPVLCSVLSMGNPHAVQFVEDIETAPVLSQGPLVEKHPLFPQYTNACYAQVIDRGRVKARVFERGVGETMACGSGACAIMVAARQLDLVADRTRIELAGGELEISWAGEGQGVEMAGPAVKVFESELDLEDL